jgi:hypothetical protein
MNCEDIRELLELYAVGALGTETQALVEKHLAECADCRKIADEYLEIINRLPEALAVASSLRPLASIKASLMQRIEEEESMSSAQADGLSVQQMPVSLGRIRSMFWRLQPIGSAAAVVLLILSVVWIIHLNTALAYEQGLRQNLAHQTELIFEVVDSDQTTRHFLRPTENAPRIPDAAPPYGKVFIRADLPYVVSMTGRLPAPPTGQVYNLWLFRQEHSELAGTIMPDEAGFGSLLYQASEDGPHYDSAQLILQAEDSDTPTGVPVLLWNLNSEG